MSFVRFGVDGSQVYIFERTGDLKKECCYCALTKRLPDHTDAEMAGMWIPAGMDPGIWRARWEPDFATDDLDAMLAHLAEHRAAGHVVPDWLDDDLRREWDDDESEAVG